MDKKKIIRIHVHEYRYAVRYYLDKNLLSNSGIEIISYSFDYGELFRKLDERPIDIVLVTSSDYNYDRVVKLVDVMFPRTRIVALSKKENPCKLLSIIHSHSYLLNYGANLSEISESIKFVHNYKI